MNLFSECCNAPPLGEVDPYGPTGICSECKENSVFREETAWLDRFYKSVKDKDWKNSIFK